MYTNDRAAIAGALFKSNRAGAINIRIVDGAPSNQFSREIVDNIGIPFHRSACRTFNHPMATVLAVEVDGLNVLHETREVLKIAHELVGFLRRAINKNRALDLHAQLV